MWVARLIISVTYSELLFSIGNAITSTSARTAATDGRDQLRCVATRGCASEAISPRSDARVRPEAFVAGSWLTILVGTKLVCEVCVFSYPRHSGRMGCRRGLSGGSPRPADVTQSTLLHAPMEPLEVS